MALAALLVWSAAPAHAAESPLAAPWPWWVWPLLLFAMTVVMGIFAVVAGIGGSVVFVPVVSGFLPLVHLDFVRGAGLIVALSGALAAGPHLLRLRLADLRLAIPFALVASLGSLFGALLGFALPAAVVQTALGVAIIAIGGVMVLVKPGEGPPPHGPDRLAVFLGIGGSGSEAASGDIPAWQPRRTLLGLVLFAGVGALGGLFGLGAGWANVPVLTLVMGVPMKVAVGTSYFLLANTSITAAWVYLSRGAVIPLIVVPSVLGAMTGAQIGARVLARTKPARVRQVVIAVMVVAGARALLRGLGI